MMVCFTFIFSTVGCEKSGDQTQSQTTGQSWPISLREPLYECEDCPIGCCCCGIEMISPSSFTISLCGLCEGDYLCGTFSPGSPCSSISGTGKDISLSTPYHPREVFCVEPGASFRVFNPNPFSVSFRFTCQYDVTPNTFITVTLTSHEERFFYNDGSCITDDCN